MRAWGLENVDRVRLRGLAEAGAYGRLAEKFDEWLRHTGREDPKRYFPAWSVHVGLEGGTAAAVWKEVLALSLQPDKTSHSE